jgi:hypothetical protein
MWNPQHLTTLQASTACYGDSFEKKMPHILQVCDKTQKVQPRRFNHTATGYEINVQCLILGRERRSFAFPQSPDLLWGPANLPNNEYGWLFRRPKREADHSPPSSVEVKNGGAITPLPHMPSWCSA